MLRIRTLSLVWPVSLLAMGAMAILILLLATLPVSASNHYTPEHELRCRPGTDNPEEQPTYVDEGDDFNLQVKWNSKRGTGSWIVAWDTNERNPTEAVENDDFEPEDEEEHSKSVLYSTFNHTLHTVDDDLFEGPEDYSAGYARVRKAGGTNAPAKYCRVEIRDDDPLKVTAVRLTEAPLSGSTFKAGETIQVTT